MIAFAKPTLRILDWYLALYPLLYLTKIKQIKQSIAPPHSDPSQAPHQHVYLHGLKIHRRNLLCVSLGSGEVASRYSSFK